MCILSFPDGPSFAGPSITSTPEIGKMSQQRLILRKNISRMHWWLFYKTIMYQVERWSEVSCILSRNTAENYEKLLKLTSALLSSLNTYDNGTRCWNLGFGTWCRRLTIKSRSIVLSRQARDALCPAIVWRHARCRVSRILLWRRVSYLF